MLKITVAGNATIDALIEGEVVTALYDTITVESDGVKETFRVEDPPVEQGRKHRINQNIVEKVLSLWHRMLPGGGGYNSVTGMRQLEDIGSELELSYLDVSIPHHLVQKELRRAGIDPHFFWQRDIPFNAIIGWKGDKFVLKGPALGRVEPDEEHIAEAREVISGSDSLLINSVKDPRYLEKYVEIAGEMGVPAYVVITTSQEPEFVSKHLLPNAICILNYDEIPFLHGKSEPMDEKSRMELALDTVRQIRSEHDTAKPIFVTLGKNGAYCASKNTLRYVYLNPEYAEKVVECIASQHRRVNGAGDSFAGALVAYDTAHGHKLCLNELLILASTASIRHIGYKGELPSDAFNVVEEPIKSPQYSRLVPTGHH